MDKTKTAFIGIEISSSQPTFTFAAIDNEKTNLGVGSGDLDDIITFLKIFPDSMAAISTPIRPGQRSRMQNIVSSQDYPKDGNRLGGSEYEVSLPQPRMILSQQNDVDIEAPAWMKSAKTFLDVLRQMEFNLYSKESSNRQWLETQSEAGFITLVGYQLYKAKSLEGRLQRQMALSDNGLPVKNPMDFLEEITPYRLIRGMLPLEDIHSSAELNALIAAYVPWLLTNRSHLVIQLQQPGGSPLYLPGWRTQDPVTRRTH